MKTSSVHIAITLREEWPKLEPEHAYTSEGEVLPKLTGLFKATHEYSRDEQCLWEYYGDYWHTHAGLGYRTMFPERNLTKEQWKEKSTKMRAEQRSYYEYLENQEQDGPGLYK